MKTKIPPEWLSFAMLVGHLVGSTALLWLELRGAVWLSQAINEMPKADSLPLLKPVGFYIENILLGLGVVAYGLYVIQISMEAGSSMILSIVRTYYEFREKLRQILRSLPPP